MLEAERAEQRRINREAFVASFRIALDKGRRILFQLPGDSSWDGNQMSRWCSSQARNAKARTAEIHLRPAVAKDLASALAELMHQWGFDLSKLSGAEALERTTAVLLAPNSGSFVTIVKVESLEIPYLQSLLTTLAARLPGEAGARITVVLSEGAAGPDAIEGADVERPDWAAIGEEDIRQHLRLSWGWSEEESQKQAAIALQLELGQQPGLLYTFIAAEGVVWDGV